jgi:precorrin-2 dehydrogenase/sirohydrochlorin ferrochelatase
MYPVFLDLTGRLAVVVGAGPVGTRKRIGLRAAGTLVRVVCLEPAAAEEGVEWVTAAYDAAHLDGAFLAVAAATPEVNARVVADCRARGVLVCSASDPGTGDFITPAVHRLGPITLAVSTGGTAPGVAAALRDHLAAQLDPVWVERVEGGR